MAQEFNRKPTTYLSVNSKGRIYTKADPQTKGAVKIETKEGKVFYHKYWMATDIGYITGLFIRENDFGGQVPKFKELVIRIETERSVDQLAFPLYDKRQNISDYVKSIILVLPNIDFTKKYSLSTNTKENSRGYVDKGLFFNINGGKEFVRYAYSFGDGEDQIPKPVKVEKIKGSGEYTYDFSEQDSKLYSIFKEQLERFENEKVKVEFNPSYEDTKPVEPVQKEEVVEKNEKVETPVTEGEAQDNKVTTVNSPNVDFENTSDDFPF